ncbi:nucleotidyltransferase domain-containing protein [bacterium]|nr:nucleotidyltransferase domain-containing protein [bacterium]MBU1615461.1 nucleotidyltransferase domain-containing protein [bacterium]
MRISVEQIDLLKNKILSILPDAVVYLFGSRIDNNGKGGDIDIMILSDRKMSWKEKAMIRWHYFERFGEQKLDIISSTFKEDDPFKQIVLHEGVRL